MRCRKSICSFAVSASGAFLYLPSLRSKPRCRLKIWRPQLLPLALLGLFPSLLSQPIPCHTLPAHHRINRTLGGTVGISVSTTIFASELARRLKSVAGYQQFASGSSQITNDFSSLNHIQPLELRQTVLHGFTRSLATIW